nr:RNA-directed DNA polymerase, eukaryota, reverse transcriptase zinc-binding domain protein [Tanacetum cinerariifolium]
MEFPNQERPILNMEFPNQLNPSQVLDLEAEVSIEEIKKIPNAKLVKDFRPISLIGSLYKIITKILANRIMLVLGDLVNEVQLAFVADRQILDGPFILNESGGSGFVPSKRCGCGVLHTPFTYLGSKVGGNMSRINAWDDIVDKLVVRLSKWKMKTLSIGGRLTLLKAVLGAMYVYHMFIFKVPMKVLHRMESIRSRFFNRVELNCKKAIWVKWCNVLASKEKGGLASLRRCPRGGAEQSQMGELIALLNDVVLGVMDDRWCWALDGMGEFSVASVRKALDALRLSCVSSQTRWIKEVPIKWNVGFSDLRSFED